MIQRYSLDLELNPKMHPWHNGEYIYYSDYESEIEERDDRIEELKKELTDSENKILDCSQALEEIHRIAYTLIKNL